MFRPAYSNSDRTLSCQNRFSPVIMSQEDVASGRPSHWPELYICGDVVNLSPGLFTDPFLHLTTLSIQKNSIVQIPPEIRNLVNLQTLNASHNKISSIPKELGDCIELRFVFRIIWLFFSTRNSTLTFFCVLNNAISALNSSLFSCMFAVYNFHIFTSICQQISQTEIYDLFKNKR